VARADITSFLEPRPDVARALSEPQAESSADAEEVPTEVATRGTFGVVPPTKP
jgi:hypothetical protein